MGLGPSLTLEEHGGVQARVVALKWSEEDSLKFCLGHRTDMKHLQNVIIWGNLEGLLGDALLRKAKQSNSNRHSIFLFLNPMTNTQSWHQCFQNQMF